MSSCKEALKGNPVKNGNCPATVKGAKAGKTTVPDLDGKVCE